MKKENTPGNWHHKDGTVFSDGGHIICQLISGRYHSDIDQRINEREANGELIAAAPKLLECLVQILSDHANGESFKHDYVLSVLQTANPELANQYLVSRSA